MLALRRPHRALNWTSGIDWRSEVGIPLSSERRRRRRYPDLRSSCCKCASRSRRSGECLLTQKETKIMRPTRTTTTTTVMIVLCGPLSNLADGGPVAIGGMMNAGACRYGCQNPYRGQRKLCSYQSTTTLICSSHHSTWIMPHARGTTLYLTTMVSISTHCPGTYTESKEMAL
jgi:hypothetical protein